MQPGQQAILDARPQLDDITLGVVLVAAEAYHDLDTCRSIGMVAGKIPWTAIREWARDQRDLDDDARAILIRAIRYVDDLEFAERAKKQAPARPPTPPRPRGPVARTAGAAL